jgi:diguanylate cyclase (GGDEF)-like protein
VESVKPQETIFDLYPEIGKGTIDNPAKAEIILEKAIKELRKKNRNDMIAQAYYCIAECNFRIGNARKVISNAVQAIGYVRQSAGIEWLLPKCYNMAGIGYASSGEYNVCQQYYLEALKYAKQLKDERTELSVQNNIGSLFLQLGDYREASQYVNTTYEKAAERRFSPDFNRLTETEKIDRIELYYAALLNLADLYYHEESYDSCLRSVDRLEETMEENNISRNLPIYVNNLYTIRAKAYLGLGDVPAAQDALEELFTRLNDEESLAETTELFEDYQELCRILLQDGEEDLSWRVLEIMRRVCGIVENVSRWLSYFGLVAQFQAAYGSTDDYFHACAQYHNYGMENELEQKRAILMGVKNQIEVERSLEIQKKQFEQAEEIRLLSETDELTGLLNRRSFNRLSQTYYKAAAKDLKEFGFIMMDIDYFKQYNDFYGHVAGDKCLKTIAKILKTHCKEGFLPSRYGGDEFIIIVRDHNDDEVRKLMDTIVKSVRSKNILHEKSAVENYVTVTLGAINCVPGKKQTLMDMVQLADDALYEAKKQGKNRALFKDV